MKNESYWKALSQALVKSGFETAPIDHGVLPVHWQGKLLGWVEPDGSALFDVDTHTAHREACETVSRVAVMPSVCQCKVLVEKHVVMGYARRSASHNTFVVDWE